MDNDPDLDLTSSPQAQTVVDSVQHLAKSYQGNCLALLSLLRLLEGLHQEVRDSLFQESLPDNRQALYALLREIESSGGWPYIPRFKLQTLLANWSMQLNQETKD